MKEEIDSLRAGLYSLLAALLLEPPAADLLERLRKMRAVSGTEGALAQALDGLARVAVEIGQADLEQEFHELFVGITRGELLPYASWYLTGYLHEAPLARLRSDIHAMRIVRDPSRGEPEDHIGAICETLALLVNEGDPRQRELFENHLMPWGGRFFQDLADAGPARFYRAVAELGQVFLEAEMCYIGPD